MVTECVSDLKWMLIQEMDANPNVLAGFVEGVVPQHCHFAVVYLLLLALNHCARLLPEDQGQSIL